MYDFFTAELARFEANPIGQIASYLAIVALFGVGAIRPFLNLPVAFTGTAKLLQFVGVAAVAAVAVSALQANVVAHFSMYVIGALIMSRVIIDNWYDDDDGVHVGRVTTLIAYNGFVWALGYNTHPLIGAFAVAGAVVMQILTYYGSEDKADVERRLYNMKMMAGQADPSTK